MASRLWTTCSGVVVKWFGVGGVVVEALRQRLAEVLNRSLPARVEVGEIEWWEPN